MLFPLHHQYVIWEKSPSISSDWFNLFGNTASLKCPTLAHAQTVTVIANFTHNIPNSQSWQITGAEAAGILMHIGLCRNNLKNDDQITVVHLKLPILVTFCLVYHWPCALSLNVNAFISCHVFTSTYSWLLNKSIQPVYPGVQWHTLVSALELHFKSNAIQN